MFGQTNVKILKFLIHETGTYNTQFRRPYTTSLDGSTLNAIKERFDGVGQFTPAGMAGIAGHFIAPSAQPENHNGIAIPSGWDIKRMRFMMEVQYTTPGMGAKQTEVILGYTDHAGITASQSLDPRMEFYINSTFIINENFENTSIGNQIYTSVVDSSHILANNNFGNVFNSSHENRMRPMDVYAEMMYTHVDGGVLGNLYDGRVVTTATPVKSRRSNSLPANYMSNVLDNHQSASLGSEFAEPQTDILKRARNYSGEQLVSKDPFMSAVSAISGRPIGNMFTMDDIRRLDPGVDYVTRATVMAPVEQMKVHQVGQTMSWGGSDRYTLVATILSHAVPAIMMDNCLTKVVFKTSNYDITGKAVTQFYDALGFSSGDYSRNLENFKLRLEREVLMDISFSNQVSYAIEMTVNLLGETWIKLSLDGGPQYDYVVPSFCDALTAPVITENQNTLKTLATDFDMLISNIDFSGKHNTSLMSFAPGNF